MAKKFVNLNDPKKPEYSEMSIIKNGCPDCSEPMTKRQYYTCPNLDKDGTIDPETGQTVPCCAILTWMKVKK